MPSPSCATGSPDGAVRSRRQHRSGPRRAGARAADLVLGAALGLGTLAAVAGDGTAPDGWRRPDPALRAYLEAHVGEQVAAVDPYAIEVWLLAQDARLARRLPDPEARRGLLLAVRRHAQTRGLDPDFVLALIEVESAFDRFALSSAGAQGLMQVMPFWKGELGRPGDNLTDVETNLAYGTTILAHYLERTEGDVIRALQHYHGDRRHLVYAEKVLTAWQRRWRTRDDGAVAELLAQCRAVRLSPCP